MAPTTKKNNEPDAPEFTPKDYEFDDKPPIGDAVIPVAEPIKVEVAPPTKPYERVMWKNVVPVFKCSSCGHCENIEDDVIMHVLTHAPEAGRDKLLDKLMTHRVQKH